jgi:threonine/homoserine/homoserine lactone efflux protein
MELLGRLPLFLGAVLLIAAVPGPVVLLLIRRGSIGGFAAAAPAVVGAEVGLYAWILAAGAGLAALVATSHVAFTILRVVGAAVLLTLAVQAFLSARRGRYDAAASLDDAAPIARFLPRGRRGGFAIGLVTNLANPKAAVFTFAFYPQFIPHGYPALPTAALLGLVQIAIEGALYFALSAGIGRARSWVGRRRVRRTLDSVCGAVLVALGVRIATESA